MGRSSGRGHAPVAANAMSLLETRAAARVGDPADRGQDFQVAGLKVLLVDDDRICLMSVGQMLKQCSYEVTACSGGAEALAALRDSAQAFDLMLSEVYLPDGEEGFKLLDTVAAEADFPVVMMSSHHDTATVMRGITGGAADFLTKPLRIEELRNLWQHVVRRRRDAGHAAQWGRAEAEEADDMPDPTPPRKRKESMTMDVAMRVVDDDSSTAKKSRFFWLPAMHQRFVDVVNELGVDKAAPKKILDSMNVDLLTRENVASHLQKYRLYLKHVANGEETGPVTSQDAVGVSSVGLSLIDAATEQLAAAGGTGGSGETFLIGGAGGGTLLAGGTNGMMMAGGTGGGTLLAGPVLTLGRDRGNSLGSGTNFRLFSATLASAGRMDGVGFGGLVGAGFAGNSNAIGIITPPFQASGAVLAMLSSGARASLGSLMFDEFGPLGVDGSGGLGGTSAERYALPFADCTAPPPLALNNGSGSGGSGGLTFNAAADALCPSLMGRLPPQPHFTGAMPALSSAGPIGRTAGVNCPAAQRSGSPQPFIHLGGPLYQQQLQQQQLPHWSSMGGGSIRQPSADLSAAAAMNIVPPSSRSSRLSLSSVPPPSSSSDHSSFLGVPLSLLTSSSQPTLASNSNSTHLLASQQMYPGTAMTSSQQYLLTGASLLSPQQHQSLTAPSPSMPSLHSTLPPSCSHPQQLPSHQLPLSSSHQQHASLMSSQHSSMTGALSQLHMGAAVLAGQGTASAASLGHGRNQSRQAGTTGALPSCLEALARSYPPGSSGVTSQAADLPDVLMADDAAIGMSTNHLYTLHHEASDGALMKQDDQYHRLTDHLQQQQQLLSQRSQQWSQTLASQQQQSQTQAGVSKNGRLASDLVAQGGGGSRNLMAQGGGGSSNLMAQGAGGGSASQMCPPFSSSSGMLRSHSLSASKGLPPTALYSNGSMQQSVGQSAMDVAGGIAYQGRSVDVAGAAIRHPMWPATAMPAASTAVLGSTLTMMTTAEGRSMPAPPLPFSGGGGPLMMSLAREGALRGRFSAGRGGSRGSSGGVIANWRLDRLNSISSASHGVGSNGIWRPDEYNYTSNGGGVAGPIGIGGTAVAAASSATIDVTTAPVSRMNEYLQPSGGDGFRASMGKARTPADGALGMGAARCIGGGGGVFRMSVADIAPDQLAGGITGGAGGGGDASRRFLEAPKRSSSSSSICRVGVLHRTTWSTSTKGGTASLDRGCPTTQVFGVSPAAPAPIVPSAGQSADAGSPFFYVDNDGGNGSSLWGNPAAHRQYEWDDQRQYERDDQPMSSPRPVSGSLGHAMRSSDDLISAYLTG